MSSNRKYIDFIFTTTDYEKVQEFLDDNDKLDLTTLKDEKNSNILHQMAFQSRLPLMKLYLQHMRKVFEADYWKSNSQYKKSVKLAIQGWINETNNDGFTPIHYASYKGNVEMIKLLENLGASIVLETKAGLNVLHLAAQGDRMTSMIHLYDRFDLNCIDAKKGTPLHWACYMGSENVAAFLLAQEGVLIDAFDDQQQTPLHLATIYGNTRIVRRLLTKGADRTLRNGKGEKPIEIAIANEFNTITKMLSEDFTCIDQCKFYYNIKTEYRPQNRSYLRSILLVLGLLFCSMSCHLLIVPKFNEKYLLVPGIYYVVLLILILSMMTTPKTIDKPRPYKQLINQLPICAECKIPKKQRSFHCETCKVCVSQYDHHCPWTNNCVGKNNIGRFVMFLVMMIVAMLEITLVSLCGILEYDRVVEGYRFEQQFKSVKILDKIIFGFNIAICMTFILPVTMLSYVQISNLCLGLTTYERFSNRNRKNNTKSTSIKDSVSSEVSSNRERLLNKSLTTQPSEGCSFGNCVAMCSSEPTIVKPEDESM